MWGTNLFWVLFCFIVVSWSLNLLLKLEEEDSSRARMGLSRPGLKVPWFVSGILVIMHILGIVIGTPYFAYSTIHGVFQPEIAVLEWAVIVLVTALAFIFGLMVCLIILFGRQEFP